jgi:CBS domain-containing protein
MQVRDVMTREVVTCGRETTLATAATRMWEGDCGLLPVLDPEGMVVGVLTDRDICMTLAWTDRPASQATAGEVVRPDPRCCGEGDTVQEALERMGRDQVHRLPVVDPDGRLRGIVSIRDLARAARRANRYADGAPSYPEVMEAYRAISHGRKSGPPEPSTREADPGSGREA